MWNWNSPSGERAEVTPTKSKLQKKTNLVKRAVASLLPIIAIGLVGCSKAGPEKTSHRSIPLNYVEGSFVVTATATSSADSMKASSDTVASELGCKVAGFDPINWGSEAEGGVVSAEMKNSYNVRFENCDFSKDGTESILAKFEAQTGVKAAEAEALAAATPIKENDPSKSAQSHLNFIHRDQACNASERNNSKPIIVAVVDSGVDKNHVDLKDSFYRDQNGRIVGANFVGAGSQMSPDDNWDDKAGHGTHVAGLIDAAANNAQGVVGVAACANIKIMPVRVLNDEGRGTSIEIERGIKWAADHGAQIVNLSLGYVTTTSNAHPSQYRSIYADLAKKDVVVFAAAGNDGMVNGGIGDGGRYQFNYPSSYDHVISVAASYNSGTLTGFSNRGDLVDIAAPGYQLLSTTMDGRYGRMSGTSMATPVAAGAYALALASAAQGLEANVDRIDANVAEDLLKSSILSSATLSRSDVASGGVIDVEKLVKATMKKFPKIEDEQPVDQPEDQPNDTTNPTDENPNGDVTTPTDPVDTTPVTPVTPVTPNPVTQPQPVKDFSFVGLVNGQKAGYPQSIEMENVPSGTYVVYFYWGDSFWSFTKVYTNGKTSIKDPDQWYLYGDRTLTAVAFNSYGRILKVAQVSVKGL